MGVTTTFQGTALLGTGSTSVPASEGLITQSANASTSPLLGTDLNATNGATTLTNLSTVDGTAARTSSTTTSTKSASNASTTATSSSGGTTTVKQTAVTELIPNPLFGYASYTYSWSLWFLGLSDYNALVKTNDVLAAAQWQPTKGVSYVVAEDSGRYPDWRVPHYGLDYNIKSVSFNTTIAPSDTAKSSPPMDGKIQIVEPLGITFLDSLIEATKNQSTGQYQGNYAVQPYMLQLDFFGYDDNGNFIPAANAAAMSKRFPINITKCKVEVTNHGATYDIEFAPTGQSVLNQKYGKTPKQFTITAGTVGEFFTNFQHQLNDFYMNDSQIAGNAIYYDQYNFLIDPSISKSQLNYSSVVQLSQSNPATDGIDLSKNNFNIAAGTDILSIIDRVFAQSQFLTQNQLNLGVSTSAFAESTNSAGTPINIIRTQVGVQYGGGTGSSSQINYGVFDPMRNTYPMILTLAMHQYQSNKGESPNAGVAPDTRAITIKQYNYLYTGQNIDVIDFKLRYNLAYYNAVLGYTNSIAASLPTQTTGADTQLQYVGATKITPGLLTAAIPGLSYVANPTPSVFQFIVNDQHITHGMGVQSSSDTQKGMDLLKSLYTNPHTGDMCLIEAKIIGDPVFLKQDNWLYIQDPTLPTSVYNQWDTVSQSDFFKQVGHIRTDVGDVVVQFNINTPVDYDIDVTGHNTGLVYPAINTKASTFSGQYRIFKIHHVFDNGVFTQVLTLVRYINSSLIGATAGNTTSTSNSVSTGQSNNNGLVPTNGR